MRRASFGRRIVLLLVAALSAAQVLALVAVLVATRANVRSESTASLSVAQGVFERLYEARFRQLSASVEVLASDFGFKRAMATADMPTMRSVLENHGARAGAQLAVIVGSDGRMASSDGRHPSLERDPAWQAMVSGLRRSDYALATLVLDGAAFQVVAVPVLAPEPIGWLLMGFDVGAALARELQRLTGLEVSFLTRGRPPTLLGSTLAPSAAAALARLDPAALGPEVRLAEEDFLTRALALDEVSAVLQQSLTAALAPYRRLAWELAGCFAVVFALALVAGASLARSLTRPVRALADAAARIGEGDYRVTVAVAGEDEIGQLADTLNRMQLEIAEREHRLVHQAHHDDLTGLPNRWLAQDRLTGAIHRAERSGRAFTLVLLDLARFKQINDSLGHHVGDVVLKEIARRLVARARRSDTVARLGGDDFLLLLEATDAVQARVILGVLRDSLTQAIDLDGMHVALDFRAGLVSFPEHGADASALMRRAEIAMYDAREAHDWLVSYKSGRDDGHLRQLAIVATLPGALARDELSLVYQPKADLATGGLHQAEALVRWIHPEFGYLPPDEFITVIEQSGNISLLTDWIINRAARQCQDWLRAGLDVRVSINLSALDLADDELPAKLERALAAHDLAPRQLGLEVTESAVMRDPGTALAVLARLRAAGFGLAIDDFGTGYSSLAQLKRMPVEELKIDKSFVLHLTEDAEDAVIVKSTIDLAHTLGLKVVAEGVENQAAWHTLRHFGCDLAQGYFIAKPLPPAEFEHFLRANGQSCVALLEQAA
ncbi:MAG: putative bifunctional diguanylate cyclase/phosphodiesterase [Gammaproteobacteria bacterium]